MNSNQDKEFIQLIQDVIAGRTEKKELCNRIYKQVYALAYPVYRDEESSMTQTKKALIEVCRQIDNIDLSKNVHKQIATMASVYYFTNAISEAGADLGSNMDVSEYKYSRIREDEELLGYMKKQVNIFRSPKAYDEQAGELKQVDAIHMALLELYAYEMHSVDAIESLTDIDSTYIGSWLEEARAVVLGYALPKTDNAEADAAGDDVSEAQSAYEDEYAAGGSENTANEHDVYDEYGLDEADEDNDEYEEQQAVSSVYSRKKENRDNVITAFIKKLFPALSYPARKAAASAMGCLVVIIIVAVVLSSVVSGKNKKKTANNSNYDYKKSEYTTTNDNDQPTTRASRTKNSKNGDTSTQDTDTKTEAVNSDKVTDNNNQNNSSDEKQNNSQDDNRSSDNNSNSGDNSKPQDTKSDEKKDDDSSSSDSGSTEKNDDNTGSSDSKDDDKKSDDTGSSDSGNTGNKGDNSSSSGSGNTGNKGDNSGSSDSGNTGNKGDNSGSSDSGNTGNKGDNSGAADIGNAQANANAKLERISDIVNDIIR